MRFELLVDSIQQTHSHLQQQAAKAINVALTMRNWLIGYYIVEFEQNGEERAQYGEKLLPQLAERLNEKSLSHSSLKQCRLFYIAYPQISQTVSDLLQDIGLQQFAISQTLSDQFQLSNNIISNPVPSGTLPVIDPQKLITNLSYSHLLELMVIADPLKRSFYELSSIKGGWSVRELKRQINSLYYERSGLSAKPEKLEEITQHNAETLSAADIVKSVYAFEFLGLKVKDVVEEDDLETALLDHLQDFMLEMGHGFCLEARQKRILIGDEYFFIDLVFYHRILKCHVLVELKVDAFNHVNIGQLNTYVSYYKANVMQPDDNPTVGILLVTDKNQALVQYATAGMENRLFVSKYMVELPTKETLEAFITQEIKNFNR